MRDLQFNAAHSQIPKSIPILVIHGQKDLVVPFSCTTEIFSSIPHAKAVSIGPNHGQVPNLDFGHQWYEYFDIEIWVGVFEEWMKMEGRGGAKL